MEISIKKKRIFLIFPLLFLLYILILVIDHFFSGYINIAGKYSYNEERKNAMIIIEYLSNDYYSVHHNNNTNTYFELLKKFHNYRILRPVCEWEKYYRAPPIDDREIVFDTGHFSNEIYIRIKNKKYMITRVK